MFCIGFITYICSTPLGSSLVKGYCYHRHSEGTEGATQGTVIYGPLVINMIIILFLTPEATVVIFPDPRPPPRPLAVRALSKSNPATPKVGVLHSTCPVFMATRQHAGRCNPHRSGPWHTDQEGTMLGCGAE